MCLVIEVGLYLCAIDLAQYKLTDALIIGLLQQLSPLLLHRAAVLDLDWLTYCWNSWFNWLYLSLLNKVLISVTQAGASD